MTKDTITNFEEHCFNLFIFAVSCSNSERDQNKHYPNKLNCQNYDNPKYFEKEIKHSVYSTQKFEIISALHLHYMSEIQLQQFSKFSKQSLVFSYMSEIQLQQFSKFSRHSLVFF